MIDHENVERLRMQYPEGTRICLDCMGPDPHRMPDGSTGTVDCVDDLGTLFVSFDNGRIMGVIPEADKFHVIEQEENMSEENEDEQEDKNMEEENGMTMNMGV